MSAIPGADKISAIPGADKISAIPGADKMSAVPDRLGPPSFRRLTDPMTSCRITPDSRQVWLPCIRMVDTGPMLSAARSNQVPTQRVGTRMTALGATFYDTLPPGEGQGEGIKKETGRGR